MIKNMGTFLFLFIALAIAVVLVVLIRKILLKYSLTQKLYYIIEGKLFYNSLLRSFLTSYLTLSVSTFIGITNLKFETSGDIVASVMAIVTTLIVIAGPVLSFVFLKINKEKLMSDSYQRKFSSLYLNQRIWKELVRY